MQEDRHAASHPWRTIKGERWRHEEKLQLIVANRRKQNEKQVKRQKGKFQNFWCILKLLPTLLKK